MADKMSGYSRCDGLQQRARTRRFTPLYLLNHAQPAMQTHGIDVAAVWVDCWSTIFYVLADSSLPDTYLLSVLDGAAREVDVILQDSLPRAPRHELLTGRWDSLPERAMVHIIRVSEKDGGTKHTFETTTAMHCTRWFPARTMSSGFDASMSPMSSGWLCYRNILTDSPPFPNSPKEAQNRLDSPGAVCFFLLKMSPLNYPTDSPGDNFFYAYIKHVSRGDNCMQMDSRVHRMLSGNRLSVRGLLRRGVWQ